MHAYIHTGIQAYTHTYKCTHTLRQADEATPYHTIPYHTIPYLTMLYHTIPHTHTHIQADTHT